MPRKSYNPLEELFLQAEFSLRFKNKYPQCSNCKHVQELIFSERYYNNWLRKEVCPLCDKYEKDKMEAETKKLWPYD